MYLYTKKGYPISHVLKKSIVHVFKILFTKKTERTTYKTYNMKTIKNSIVWAFFGVLLLVLASCQKEYFDILENTGSTDLKMGFTTKGKDLKSHKIRPYPNFTT